mgnify:FL=1
MNIMITNISLTRFSNIRKSQYELDDKEGSELQTDGFVTSEAPIKLLIKKLRKSQGKLDKIIFIESDKVREKIDIPAEKEKMSGDQKEFVDYMSDEKEVTLVSYLKKRLNDTAERCGLANPEIIEVNITDEPDDKDLVQCIMDVQNELIKQSDNRKINVYIDANGGIRYVMVMLTSIMNVLESQYNNIKLQSVYSTIFDDSKTKKVRDTKSTYISAQLVAAVNEFTNYGRITSLKNYFDMRHSMDNSKDTWRMWNDIDKCIEKLSEISEALQLCRSSVILELFYGKRDSSEFGINAILNKFKEEYKNSDFADAKIFSYVIDIINKQYAYLYENIDENDNKDAINNLPRVIKWCVDKDYIQQAITIYIEKMPEYYFHNEYIDKKIVDLNNVEIGQMDSSKASKGFYTELYEYCAGNVKEESFCDKVKQKVLKIWDKAKTQSSKESAFIREMNLALDKKIDADLKKALEEVKEIAVFYINNNKPPVIKLKNNGEHPIKAGKFEGFMNSLDNGNKNDLYAIIYKCENNEEKQSNTYEKKVSAIENLIRGKVKMKNSDKLIHAMKYYLAVKLIRNRVNHASEKDISEDEKMAISKMEEYGIIIDMNFENIKNILLQGIKEM